MSLCALLLFVLAESPLPAGDDYEEAPIHYWTQSSNDRLARLQRDLRAGNSNLRAETPQGLLKQLLDYLEVPVDSQVLVYSKTSHQNPLIHPRSPRAIYFSDDCYVGWVQHGAIEAITFDKRLGAVIYLIQIATENGMKKPVITRPQSCVSCHVRSVTHNVPGGLVRSVLPSANGAPLYGAGTHFIDDSSPLEERWGGWYVTGDPGAHTHMGNAVGVETKQGYALRAISSRGIQLASLDGVIDTQPYLGGGFSDIVALMALEHQVKMHNLLTAANMSVRRYEHSVQRLHRTLNEPVPAEPSGTFKQIIEGRAKEIVKHLLFTEELELTGGSVHGGTRFAEAFRKNRQCDDQGRSLKDFCLEASLFTHRCSYVIYSEVFDHLVAPLKQAVYRHLFLALTNTSESSLAHHLSGRERQRIFEILAATKKDLPHAWREYAFPEE